jgi:hypothetical protein
MAIMKGFGGVRFCLFQLRDKATYVHSFHLQGINCTTNPDVPVARPSPSAWRRLVSISKELRFM